MAKKSYSVSWRIPHSLWVRLNRLKSCRQSLAGVVEDILDEYDALQEKRDPLLDKISKLQNDLDYFEQQNITPKLIGKLAKRRHPYQTIGGVIEEIIDIAEKVDRGEIFLFDKPYGKDE